MRPPACSNLFPHCARRVSTTYTVRPDGQHTISSCVTSMPLRGRVLHGKQTMHRSVWHTLTTKVLPGGTCFPFNCEMASAARYLSTYVTNAQPRDFPLLLRNTYSSMMSPMGENTEYRSCSVACPQNHDVSFAETVRM